MGNAPERHTIQWHAIGQSVRGASHVRSGLPNQDAIDWQPKSGDGPPLIVAVSDGHGSPKSFRSDVGSQFAVEQTVAIIQELVAGQPATISLSMVKRAAEERLPQEIVRRWQEAVNAHLRAHPFETEELDALETKQGGAARDTVFNNPHLAYGATILSILVTDTYILYLQLGDGDILAVMPDGAITRPVPGDERLFANQTTSLCSHDAWRDMRLRFQTLYGVLPALILISSDGYANSFVNDDEFLKVGVDILDILKTDGVATVAANLPDWLNDATKSGSGDDITLAIIYRSDIPATPKKRTADSATPPIEKKELEKFPESPDAAPQPPKVDPDAVLEEELGATSPIEEGPPAEIVEETASTPPPAEEVKPVEVAEETPDAPPQETPVVTPSVAETTPSPTSEAAAATPPAPRRRRRRRIKYTEGPLEPSKKLPDRFYED
ncbi:MAG TPA: protein phosphatase 2C domain-containing protein [Anaerolineae bacterium]|nr:protein phosphatase 2C domain-containing protein [Anaerolineae bacterium]